MTKTISLRPPLEILVIAIGVPMILWVWPL